MADRVEIPPPYLTLSDVDNPSVTWGLTIYAGHVTAVEKVGDMPWKPMATIPGVLCDFITPFSAMFTLWLTPRGLPSDRNNPNPNVVDAIRRERFARRQRPEQQHRQGPAAAAQPEKAEAPAVRYYSERELNDIGKRADGRGRLVDIAAGFGVDLRDGVPRKLSDGIAEIMAAQVRHRNDAASLNAAPDLGEDDQDDGWADEEDEPEGQQTHGDGLAGVTISKETLEALNWDELRVVAKANKIPRKNRQQITEDLLNKAAEQTKKAAAAAVARTKKPDGHFGGTI